MTTASDLADELERLAARATPGDWHHCNPFVTVPASRTVHGPVPAERVDYVSTWPGLGTPPGHRVVIGQPGREGTASSEDMALIAALKTRLPEILSALRRVECPRCADIRQRTKEEAEALATLRDRGMKLSDAQNVKADTARQALTGEA